MDNICDVAKELEFIQSVIDFAKARFPAVAFYIVLFVFRWQMAGLLELQKLGITAFMRG